ncbi:hypothetical protein [Natronospora cellulosivora (SeqCode)]
MDSFLTTLILTYLIKLIELEKRDKSYSKNYLLENKKEDETNILKKITDFEINIREKENSSSKCQELELNIINKSSNSLNNILINCKVIYDSNNIKFDNLKVKENNFIEGINYIKNDYGFLEITFKLKEIKANDTLTLNLKLAVLSIQEPNKYLITYIASSNINEFNYMDYCISSIKAIQVKADTKISPLNHKEKNCQVISYNIYNQGHSPTSILKFTAKIIVPEKVEIEMLREEAMNAYLANTQQNISINKKISNNTIIIESPLLTIPYKGSVSLSISFQISRITSFRESSNIKIIIDTISIKNENKYWILPPTIKKNEVKVIGKII